MAPQSRQLWWVDESISRGSRTDPAGVRGGGGEMRVSSRGANSRVGSGFSTVAEAWRHIRRTAQRTTWRCFNFAKRSVRSGLWTLFKECYVRVGSFICLQAADINFDVKICEPAKWRWSTHALLYDSEFFTIGSTMGCRSAIGVPFEPRTARTQWGRYLSRAVVPERIGASLQSFGERGGILQPKAAPRSFDWGRIQRHPNSPTPKNLVSPRI